MLVEVGAPRFLFYCQRKTTKEGIDGNNCGADLLTYACMLICLCTLVDFSKEFIEHFKITLQQIVACCALDSLFSKEINRMVMVELFHRQLASKAVMRDGDRGVEVGSVRYGGNSH